jgi:phosphoglycolate phosphatase
MSRFRIVVFDLDGTLVHSAPDLHVAANRMLGEMDRPALSLAQVTGFVGNGVPKLVERCLRATGGVDDMHADALARFSRHYMAAPADLTRPYPGVVEAARALREAGCRLGVCTNKPAAPARKLLGLLGMEGLFDALVGGDSLPEKKPDPAPLHHVIRELGGAAGGRAGATLYVGDSETDEATAQNAGVPFALFTGGYRKAPAEAMRAAYRFDDFADLPGILAAGARGQAGRR